MASPAAREPGPRVILVLCLTVAKVDSMGLVTGMKGRGAAGSAGLLAAGAVGVVGIRCDRPGTKGRRERSRVGRPVLFGGLGARVSSWPPLRPARLRCARGSVGVVSPTLSRSWLW
jgi:hypothetical protein